MMSRARSQHDLRDIRGYKPEREMRDWRDWRAAISTPLTYRVGNSTLHFRAHQLLAYTVISLSVIFLFYASLTGPTRGSVRDNEVTRDSGAQCPNTTYPGTRLRTRAGTKLRLAVIADLDTDSRLKEGVDKWSSFLMTGSLELSRDKKRITVTWDEKEVRLDSSLAAGGRGMELSELSVFNGRLLSLDDRTGVVYSIIDNKVVPWVILADGSGASAKGFKGEWSTVKGDKLIVGGLGKEWTTQTGDIVNHDPMWVKEVSCDGGVRHLDWRGHYEAVRASVGISWPGYMIHEAVCWSQVRREWVFLPRRMSGEKYNDVTDERMGTNTMIIASEDFSRIRHLTVGERVPTHGFSSCKFVPGTEDELMVALKSEEIEGRVATYMMAFTIGGEVIMEEERIGERKFEGIEFI